MNKPLTLFDIFLQMLERNGSERLRHIARKIKILMCLPECSEYLNFCLISDLGYRISIREDVVDKAIDFLVSMYESDIEDSVQESQAVKESEKIAMRMYMEKYRSAVIIELNRRGLLL